MQVRLIYPLGIIAHCAHAAIFYKHADETSTAFWFPVVLGVIIVIAWIVRMPSTDASAAISALIASTVRQPPVKRSAAKRTVHVGLCRPSQ